MRETKQQTIDGHIYSITQLGAKKGRIVLARVLRVVASAAEGDAPIAKIAQALTDAEIEYLCDEFSATTTVAAETTPDKALILKDVFDLHFAGRYDAMMKWLWAALEVNYSSFLSGLGLTAEALQAAKDKGMNSILRNPTGRSGDLSSTASAG